MTENKNDGAAIARALGRLTRPPFWSPQERLRIAVDFDGVLFNHVPHMLRALRDNHNVDLLDEGLRHWDFMAYRSVQEAGLTYQGIKTLLHAIETDLEIHDTDLRDETARHVMEAWREAGHEVYIVTARDSTSHDATKYFLERNDVPYDGIVMDAKVKTGYDLLVDDAPHNVLAASGAGGLAFLMDHPYNRGVRTGMNPRRVRTWSEVGAKFIALSRAVPRARALEGAALAMPQAVTSKVGAVFDGEA
ncbi:MAG TPA: hypothetical protein VNZ52_15600 [Candidatus Thermoplasmatota archaeon]|nr:hypothetical protein [Candidatus Thermoplasmatota archaeon]